MSAVKFSDSLLTKANSKLAFALAASILLSACGAGGGSDTAAVESNSADNQSPEVVEQAPQQVSPVQIFTHPQNIIIQAGENASFSVAASGGGSLSYQWLKNGQEIQGADSNSLILSNVSKDDEALFSVVVSNSAGSKKSHTALLTVQSGQVVIIVDEPEIEEPVVEAPVVEEPVVESLVIVTQPENVTVDENGNANFSVQVSGADEISYQWLKDGAIIQGQTSETLTISPALLADAAEYSVVVTSSESVIFSDVVSLTVNTVQVSKSIALSWDIPQEREDGSALEIYEIEGYVIVYGTDANNLNQQVTVQGASVKDAVLENLASGTYYFAIATIDSDGTQGAYSTTIQQSI